MDLGYYDNSELIIIVDTNCIIIINNYLIIISPQIPTDSDSEVGIEILMERMRKLTEEEEETTHEERLKRFEKVESQSVECEYKKNI